MGLWCFVPLFLVVLSGVVISYPWASNLVYSAYGMQPPSQGKGKGRPVAVPRQAADVAGVDALVARAKAQVPAWRSIGFAVPASKESPLVFNIDSGNGGQPQKRASLTLDRATGAVLRWETFGDQEPGRRARTWMRFVHTGEYYGLPGQTVAGLASAGGALLVWTGLALAYRRLRAWLGRTRRPV